MIRPFMNLQWGIEPDTVGHYTSGQYIARVQ